MTFGLLAAPGLGRATSCVAYGVHTPEPLRFVWHHVLPLEAGGKTEPTNLVSVCDSCHYAVHALMWLLATGRGLPEHTHRAQRRLALTGYGYAQALGTVTKIPNEGSVFT